MLKVETLQMGDEDDFDGVCDDISSCSESDEDADQDVDWAVKHQHTQLHCLFQIMYFQMFHGSRKTPLHATFGQSVNGKCRSRELLTSMNRIWCFYRV